MKNLKYLVLLLLAMVALHAHAYDFELNGIYYNVISKTDLTCAVTYENYGCSTYSGNVVIPASVTFKNKTLSVVRIDDEAFCVCTDLTNVTIPNSVTSIGEGAFANCI